MIYTYISESDAYQQYDEMIDELYPNQVGNILASRILSELDPIAYSCGFDDWLDANELTTEEDEEEND